MKNWLSIVSALIIILVVVTDINTDYILLGLIVALAISLANTAGLSNAHQIVLFGAVFIAMITAFILGNIIEGRLLPIITITMLITCINIRYLKFNDEQQTEEI